MSWADPRTCSATPTEVADPVVLSPFSYQVHLAMDSPIQVDLGRIAQDLQIRRVQVESVVQLLDEGNTVPFITRYRKERTGNLNEMAIREIQLRVGRLRELAERKETILKAIEAQGKLSEELAAAIRSADNPKRLEDLYLPFKPKKKTKASDARDKGLEPLALRIWNHDDTLTDLEAAAQEFVSPEKELETTEKVLEGVGHILAEAINELAVVRDAVRRVVWKTGKVVTTKAEIPEGEGLEYRDYFAYSEPIANIPPHRVLAINRGDKEGPLKVKLEVPRPEIEAATFAQLPLDGHPQAEFFRKSALDALDRLLLPSMEREVRRDLTEMAERHAVDVFARNLRSLLLQPPIPKQVVMAIDPGFRNGCKVAVLGDQRRAARPRRDPPAPAPEPPARGQALPQGPGRQAQGRRGRDRQRHRLPGDRGADRRDHRRRDALPQQSRRRSTPEPPEPAPEASPEPTAPSRARSRTPPPAPKRSRREPRRCGHGPDAGSADRGLQRRHGHDPRRRRPRPVESLPPISGGSPESETEPTAENPQPPRHRSRGTQGRAAEDPATDADARSRCPPALAASRRAPGSRRPSPSTEPPIPRRRCPAERGRVTAVGAPTEAPTATAEADGAAAAAAPNAAGRSRAEAEESSRISRPGRPSPRAPPPPPKPHPADEQLAQLAYVIVNEAGRQRLLGQPGRPRGVPRLRRQGPRDDLDRPEAPGPAGRAGQDRAPEHRRRPLSARREPQAAQGVARRGDRQLRQLRRRGPEHRERPAAPPRLGPEPAHGPAGGRASGPAGAVHQPGPVDGGRRGRPGHLHPGGRASSRSAAARTRSTGPGSTPRATPPPRSSWRSSSSRPTIVRERDRLPELHAKLDEADIPALAKELEIGEPTLRDIFDALARPERDPRDDLPKPIFKKGVLKLEDLVAGMELKGTVLNVVDFGAFVDIGLKDSGLVHISQLANRYIKSPHDVVSVGDVVTVWVMGVDGERKRVSLTMVKPGTERPRGERASGGGVRPSPARRRGRRPRGRASTRGLAGPAAVLAASKARLRT